MDETAASDRALSQKCVNPDCIKITALPSFCGINFSTYNHKMNKQTIFKQANTIAKSTVKPATMSSCRVSV